MNHAYSTAQMAEEADYSPSEEKGYREEFGMDKDGRFHARGGRFASEKEVKDFKRRERDDNE